MNRQYKEMIKEINAGKNLEMNLPLYSKEMSSLLTEYGALQFTFEYFGLKEMFEEDLEGYEDAKSLVSKIQAIVDSVFIKKETIAKREELIGSLDSLRNVVMDKMDVLTMYTDQLQIYEYVLNRKELAFASDYEKIEEEVFKQQLLQYIFSTKDNYVINERIKETVGQLPVRMTKSRYFDYVKDSLSIYKDGDKNALDSYLYMLRTCAMLYKPKNNAVTYDNLHHVVSVLEATSFETLTKEEYQKLCSMLLDSSLFMNQITDLYMVVQKVINYLYVYVLTLPYADQVSEPVMKNAEQLVGIVYRAFDTSFEVAQMDEIHSIFAELEGAQEEIFDKYTYMASVLSAVKENFAELVASMALEAEFSCLYLADKLCNSSVFIDLHQKEDNFAVTEEYLQYQMDQFMMELTEFFKSHPQCVNRAVMASTLSKMPVFFNNTEEVMEYISSSLEQCKNEAEKTVSMRLLLECIEDAMSWSK